MIQIAEDEYELMTRERDALRELAAAVVRLRDAQRAIGGPNDPRKDYAVLLHELYAAEAALLRLADRIGAATAGKEATHAIA